jgi:hypothetical protein
MSDGAFLNSVPWPWPDHPDAMKMSCRQKAIFISGWLPFESSLRLEGRTFPKMGHMADGLDACNREIATQRTWRPRGRGS